MRNTLEARIGLFFAVVLVAAVLVIELSSGMDLWGRGYKVQARFQDLHALKVGDPVKMGGVQVGEVEQIQLGNTNVSVRMRIREPYEIKTDSEATIKFTGLMGGHYVSLSFGSPEAPVASPGIVLPTRDRPDLSTLMAKLGNVAQGVESMTESFSGESFSELMGPLTDFIRQNRPRVEGMLKNFERISSKIAKGEGTVGRLIHDDRLYTEALGTVDNLDTTAQEIRTVVTNANEVVRGVREGRGTLGRLATDEALYTETKEAAVQLREILEKINRGDGSVGKLVNEEEFYNNLKLTLQKLERATDTLEDTGPMSVVGTAAGSLF